MPDQTATEKAAAPIATLSSNVDPYPHYIMGTACGGAGVYSYMSKANPRAAAIAGAAGLAYFWAGRLLASGNEKLGYDIGTVTSLGLLAATGPAAYSVGEAYNVALASIGGMSGIANLIKSYQLRTGAPKELEMRK